jgi:hypothetical protein
MGFRHGQYRETLRVPVSYWLLAVPVVALLGAEIYAGFSSLVAYLVYAAFVIVVGGFLLAWGATRVEVRDGELRAGGGTLPLGAISEVAPLDAEQARVLTGPRADPAAYLLLRPYLKEAVYIGLAETAALDVPYWVVATRRPGQLAAAISGSHAAVG